MPISRQVHKYMSRFFRSCRKSQPIFTAKAPTGNNAAHRYERMGLSRNVTKPDSRRLKEMFHTPKVMRQTIPAEHAANMSRSQAFQDEVGLRSSWPSTDT